jgi:peptidoglycan lytic transglycosylase G
MRRLGLLALLVIAAIGAGAGWMDSQISRPYRGHRPEKVFVDIPHGTSRWNIAGILRRDDVIRNRLAFELFSLWHIRAPLEAGEYFIDHPVTTREVFWQVAQGRIFVHTVTIPEGWTMFDIASEMDREGICSREDFLNAAQNSSLILDLAPNAKNLEGFLFPSTYEFTHHATCEQVVKRMVQNFRAVWESLSTSESNAFPQGLSADQVVTLASLVERETPRREERPLVAGVFYNRLKHGGPLQCDPTVAYALELEGHPVKIVHAKDLQVDSPYNTYKNPGLPPGPIANPGEASLRAALLPAETDYMFFVANDNGGHFFSKTLAEHNRNVAKYRRLLSGETPAEEATAKKPSHRGPS